MKTRPNFTSSFLDQNNLKSKNELIYIKDFKVVQTIRSRVFKPDKTLLLIFCPLNPSINYFGFSHFFVRVNNDINDTFILIIVLHILSFSISG